VHGRIDTDFSLEHYVLHDSEAAIEVLHKAPVQMARANRLERRSIDFLLRAHRDKTATRRYLEKAIAQNRVSETVTIDKSGANLAALEAINAEREAPIKIRQCKYLNNVVEQDHRAIKRHTRPMLGFKAFRCARILLGGIELMHMIAKGQMRCARETHPSAADQFYDLAT
jgi:transposase-like protein